MTIFAVTVWHGPLRQIAASTLAITGIDTTSRLATNPLDPSAKNGNIG